MIDSVENLLGEEIYVVKTEIFPKMSQAKTFDGEFGVCTKSHNQGKGFKYRIIIRGNSKFYLCHGNQKIEYYTKESNPEYWL